MVIITMSWGTTWGKRHRSRSFNKSKKSKKRVKSTRFHKLILSFQSTEK